MVVWCSPERDPVVAGHGLEAGEELAEETPVLLVDVHILPQLLQLRELRHRDVELLALRPAHVTSHSWGRGFESR